MSVRINLSELVEQYCETLVDIEVSTDECLSIMLRNFTENIEAGAPNTLLENILVAVKQTLKTMDDQYTLHKIRQK